MKIFSEKFSQNPVPHCNASFKLAGKFCETGSIEDTKWSGRASKLNEQMLLNVSDYVTKQKPIKMNVQAGTAA